MTISTFLFYGWLRANYPDGFSLSMDKLSEQSGFSKGSIRYALPTLECMGLIRRVDKRRYKPTYKLTNLSLEEATKQYYNNEYNSIKKSKL